MITISISKGRSQKMEAYSYVSNIALEIWEYYFMVYYNKLKLYMDKVKVTPNEGDTFYVNSKDKIKY